MGAMSTTQYTKPTAAHLLRWEAACVCCELLGVGVGLWFSLGTSATEFGGSLLFLVCVASLIVRSRHYATIRR
jgi:hypothetical protein